MKKTINIVEFQNLELPRSTERILILGCCGSGKTTLAMHLSEKLKLTHINLDAYYWQPNWTKTPNEEWQIISVGLTDQTKWVMDGTYNSTLDYRLIRADTIIYLDYPTMTCLWRVAKRTLRHHGEVRPHMAEGCKERWDMDFLHYVLIYNLTRRKMLLEKIEAYTGNKNVYIITPK